MQKSRYRVEKISADLSPGLIIIETHGDGNETVIWYLQAQLSRLILKETWGDYLYLADWQGKFCRYHIPSQTLTHTQKVEAYISIGARLGLFMIEVTFIDKNDYDTPTLVRLDSKNLSILSEHRLPYGDDVYVDRYDLCVRRPFSPLANELWLYICSSYKEPEPHSFYRLNLLSKQESIIELPHIGNHDEDFCLPALNLELNLGVMLCWDEMPVIIQDDESTFVFQLCLFDIDKSEIIRKLPVRTYTASELKHCGVDAEIIQFGKDDDIDDYYHQLTHIYSWLKAIDWQEDKLLLTFADKTLLLHIDGQSEEINTKTEVTRTWLPEARLAEKIGANVAVFVDDPEQAFKQMLTVSQDIESARRGNTFSFMLLDIKHNIIEQKTFYKAHIGEHIGLMKQILANYCHYIETECDEETLWETNGEGSSLCHLANALASTGDVEFLPLLLQYVSKHDSDHDCFMNENIAPTVRVAYDEELPLVKEILSYIDFDDWGEDWD
ncbi:hypothetical protein SAMN04488136_101301 [Vibrio xiamenensis]|uniref:Uncharacterized protein n=1 Tax=Vibrio xiamenensis TaxID=861298 RepID=A0A1G7WBD9_9VIBR|nr:hypothetical protein [Vibrio xiamenensis]SDG69204.1 hypothetical protein SAMN04488136_101301 [Vibrio xiamenensis]